MVWFPDPFENMLVRMEGVNDDDDSHAGCLIRTFTA